jgi:hypothetical protein
MAADGFAIIMGAEGPDSWGISHSATPMQTTQGGPQQAGEPPGLVQAFPQHPSGIYLGAVQNLQRPGPLGPNNDPVSTSPLDEPMMRVIEFMEVGLLCLCCLCATAAVFVPQQPLTHIPVVAPCWFDLCQPKHTVRNMFLPLLVDLIMVCRCCSQQLQAPSVPAHTFCCPTPSPCHSAGKQAWRVQQAQPGSHAHRQLPDALSKRPAYPALKTGRLLGTAA